MSNFIFSLAAILLISIIPIAYADISEPLPVISILNGEDDSNGKAFDMLIDPDAIITITIDNTHYALVTNFGPDSGIQIIDITDPAKPLAVSSIVNGPDGVGGTFENVSNALDIDTVIIDDTTYALVTSNGDDNGIQIIDITDPAQPKATSIISADPSVDGFIDLQSLGIFKTIDETFVLIGSTHDTGNPRDSTDPGKLLVVNISEPDNPIIEFVANQDGTDFLFKPFTAIIPFTVDSTNYALALSEKSNGTQILNLLDPSQPRVESTMVDDDDGDNGGEDGVGNFDKFAAVTSAAIVTINGTLYAVTTAADDNAVDIIDISDVKNPFSVVADTHTIRDDFGERNNDQGIVNFNGYDVLNGAADVEIVTDGESTYAIVTTNRNALNTRGFDQGDDGIQIIDITDPVHPLAVSSIRDNEDGFETLSGATDSIIIEADGVTYVITVGYMDQGLQVTNLNFDPPTNPSEDEAKSGGGSGSEHKTRPTFGLDHNTLIQIVDNGFTHNLNTFNITDNWHTPFDIQNVTLGESNSFSAKVYAPYKLKIQEFLFGISEVGKSHNAELRIEIWYNQTGGIEETKIIQKTLVVDPDSLNATGLKVKCQDSDTIESCDLTVITVKFLEPLKDDIMAIYAVDSNRRAQTTFLNDGFDISGVSLNPMITKDIAGTQKHEGAIKITQTAKYSNIWIAEDGRIFESNESNSFKLINQSFERYMDSGEAKNRLHSEFNSKVLSEAEQAQITLVEICPSCTKEPFAQLHESSEYVHVYSNYEKELQELIIYEGMRAEYKLDSMLKEFYPSNPYYKEYFKQK